MIRTLYSTSDHLLPKGIQPHLLLKMYSTPDGIRLQVIQKISSTSDYIRQNVFDPSCFEECIQLQTM